MTQEWRDELNRLATEFWFRSGNLAEVTPWVESAFEAGETDADVVHLWDCTDLEHVRSLFQTLAWKINQFHPWSDAARPFALTILQKQLHRYLAQEISPSMLCRLVDDLDAAFLDKQDPAGFEGWMGNLWNCCDWCNDSWTFENVPSLRDEAVSVLQKLRSIK